MVMDRLLLTIFTFTVCMRVFIKHETKPREREKNEFVNSSGMLEISVSDTHSAVRLLDLRSVRMDIVCVSHSRSNIDRDGRKENS